MLAVREGHVAVDERRDHQITDGDGLHLGADVVDDADELVADRPDCMLGFASVVPEVGAAHAAQRDPHDRVGRLLDDGVRPVADRDVLRSVEDGCSHQGASPSCRVTAATRLATKPPSRRMGESPSRGVLVGPP